MTSVLDSKLYKFNAAIKISDALDSSDQQVVRELSQQLNLPIVKSSDSLETFSFLMFMDEGHLQLKDLKQPKVSPISVDFVRGKANHRRRFGGGQGQMIAKAVGVSGRFHPHVVDVTAGLGGDAYVLASLGCRLTLLERNPIVAALLADGLRRAKNCDDNEIRATAMSMDLVRGDAVNLFSAEGGTELLPEVIYVDPMFPERKKSAAVKKEMRIFHQLVGDDCDQEQLLEKAIARAQYRVVVKRPKIAESIGGLQPSYQLSGKSSRYDIYTIKKIP